MLSDSFMKAVVVYGNGKVVWEDIPLPALPEGWVRVAVKAAGICTSDLNRVFYNEAYHYPIVLGHEMAGVVSETGPGVTADITGRKAAVVPLIPCWKCEWCQKGRFSLCDHYDYLGSRRNGGCAKYVDAPVENLLFLPDNVSTDQAALLEPASVVLHGMDGQIKAGDDVLVLGAGNLGLFAVQLARILGATRVYIIDNDPYRLKKAQELGAIAVKTNDDEPSLFTQVLKITDNRGVDVVVESCGVPSLMAGCLQAVRKGGKVIYLGWPHRNVEFETSSFVKLVRHEIQLVGSWNSFSAPFPGKAWEANLSYISDRRLKTEPITTHRFPMKSALEAYNLMKEKTEYFVKILLINED